MANLKQRCNKDSRPLGRRGRTLAYLGLFSLVSVAASGPLAAQGVKISALPDATSAGLTDMIPCVQGDTTRRCTPAEFLALLTGGVGIGISGQTISTASNEADFLISGALTCGASTQGKVQVHSTTPLQYCDNAGTPTLRYAAYGNAAGECLSVADNSIALGTKTTGGYAASVSEAGPATTASAAVSDPANCSAGSVAGGVDVSWVAQDCLDPITETELDSLAELNAQLTTTIADGPHTVDTDDQNAGEVVYTPIDGADWANPDPDDVADGLDKLADRLTAEEAKADDDVPESGDFGALVLTGPVTSSGVATAVSNDAITEPMLKAVNEPTDEFCLSYEVTTGDFEWQICSSSIGDVVGPSSSTDNAIARFDSTTGKLIQDSHLTLSDGPDPTITAVSSSIMTIQTSATAPGAELVLRGDGAAGDKGIVSVEAGSTQVGNVFVIGDGGGDQFSVHRIGAGEFGVIAQLADFGQVRIGGDSITNSTLDGSVFISPNGSGTVRVTGDLAVENAKTLRLYEDESNGVNYFGFVAPAVVTATSVCTLENDANPVPDSCVGDGTDDDLPDADEIVESMLKAVDAASDEECLTFETTTGDFEWQACAAGGGSGDVVGPASATDECFARFDTTTGKLIQNSVVCATDAGIVTGLTKLTVDNIDIDGNSILAVDANGSLYIIPNGTGFIGLWGTTSSFPGLKRRPATSQLEIVAADGTGRGVLWLGSANFNITGANYAANGVVINHLKVALSSTNKVGWTSGSDADQSRDVQLARSGVGELDLQDSGTGPGKWKRLVASAETLTIADNGGGTKATSTLTPTKSVVECTCNDTDGCTITMGETGMVSGWDLTIINVGTNTCEFADTAGVSELSAAFVAGQYDTLKLMYTSSTWVEVSRSDN